MFVDTTISLNPEVRFLPGDQDQSRNQKKETTKKLRADRGDASRRVLILEDERLVSENLKDLFQEFGHEVVGVAGSGEEALQLANSQNPDLLLMDIHVKGSMDGIQTALAMHARRKVPVIFLTAHQRHKFPELSKLDPATFVYVSKPYSKEDLIQAVRKLFPQQ